MKKHIEHLVCIIIILYTVSGYSQGITIGSGTTFSLGNSTLYLSGNWTNNGTFNAGTSTVVFNGASGSQTITNSSGETFYNLTVDKTSGNLITQNNLTADGSITCTIGSLDLNGNSCTLGSSGLVSESNGNEVTGGTVSITVPLNNPSAVNPGGLGAVITSSANLGSTTITRGVAVQSVNGNNSIKKYFDITPATDTGLNATLVFNYFPDNLNSLNESNLVLYKSTDAGTTWTSEGGAVNTVSHYVSLSGIGSFSRWTLSAIGSPVATAASNVSSVSFSANWDPAAGAAGYRLDIATDNAFTHFLAGFNNLDVSNVTTYPVSGLSANSHYYYRIRAYNSGGGISNNSNTINALTSTIAPVADLASAITTAGFSSNWNPVSGAASYRLDVSTNINFTTFVSGWNNKDVGNVTTYQVSGINSNTKYYYRIRAYNGGGFSGNSNVISLTTLDVPPVLGNIETTFLPYTVGEAAVPVTGTATVNDADNLNMSSAVVQITSNYVSGQDVLSYAQVGNISGVFDAASGKMTLTGSDTKANYQTALRSVSYKNTGSFPASVIKTVSYTVNDGILNSNTITRQIKISTLNITSPLGGDKWTENVQQQIKWKSNNINTIKIEVSTDNGTTWMVIADNYPASSGAYNWIVNNNLQASYQCFIRLTDDANPGLKSTSGSFTIVKPNLNNPQTVTLKYPNGDENFAGGTYHTILWGTTGNVTGVILEFTTDNGKTWQPITSRPITGVNFYKWKVPGTINSNLCRVKIIDGSDASVVGESLDPFIIFNIQVTNPLSGTVLYVGRKTTISWSGVNDSQTILKYSTDGGGSWLPLGETQTQTDSSYEWQIPEVQSDKCRIKIITMKNHLLSGESTGYFTIERFKGDISGDGQLSAYDVYDLLGYLTGRVNMDQSQLMAADVNGDGQVNAEDAYWILYKIVYGNFPGILSKVSSAGR